MAKGWFSMGSIIERMHPQTLRFAALLAVLFLVILFFGTQIDNYLNARLFNRISTSVAIIALLAAAQALVVLTRNIDLSVGSIVGATAFLVGNLLANNPGMSPFLAVLIALATGGLLGAVNGVLVAYGRIPAIIVTLGTLAIFRSLLVEFSGAKSITTNTLPDWLLEMPRTNVLSFGNLDLRLTVVITLSVVIALHIFLTRFRLGRKFYAVGSNPEAAVVAGINSQRIVFLAFVMCGALSGLAGFMFLAKFGNITVVAGLGLELKSVAAVVVGGTNIFGGRGTVIGVLVGAILVDLIDISLVRWDLISEFWRDGMLGLLILLAVGADAVLMQRLERVRQRKALQKHARLVKAKSQANRAEV